MSAMLPLLHHLAALVGVAATVRKGFLVFKAGFDVAVKVFAIVALIVSAVEAGPSADSTTKKAAAVAKINAELDKALPSWAVPIVNPLVGVFVDAAVAYANSTGIFLKSAAA